METGPEPSSGRPGTAALCCAGLVGVAVATAAFAGDGSGFKGVLPVGALAVGLLAAYLIAFAFGAVPLPRVGRSGGTLLLTTGLVVVWTGATIAWSIAPDRSWDTFNRGVVFAVFLGLGVALAGVGRHAAARLAASALAIVVGVVLAWALLAKSIPALDPAGIRVARLSEPVDYWNALALIANIALPLALWVGASRGRKVSVRILGGLLAYAAVLVLLMTISRAGAVVAIGVVLLWLVLSSERVEGGLLLAAAGVPAALVAGWAFTRPALVDAGAAKSDRVADGAVFGGLASVGALVVVALVGLGARRELSEHGRRRAGRVLLAVAVVALAVAVVAVAVSIRNPVSWFRDDVTGSSCSEVVNDPSRLGSLNVNSRWCWWNEATDVFAQHTPLGAGAGTFEIARKRFRSDERSVLQPHSVPLQHLADGGIPGLVFFLALVGAAAWVCVCTVRRLEGGERAAAVALVAAPVAYLAHALVDYTWDFLAVTAPTMVALGVLDRSRATRVADTTPCARRSCGRARRALRCRVVRLAAAGPARRALVDRGSGRRRLRYGARSGASGSAPRPALRRAALRTRPDRRAPPAPVRGATPLHRRRRAAARESGHLVHARPLRVSGSREHVRRLPAPERRIHPRPVGQPVGEGRPARRRARRRQRGCVRAWVGGAGRARRESTRTRRG